MLKVNLTHQIIGFSGYILRKLGITEAYISKVSMTQLFVDEFRIYV